MHLNEIRLCTEIHVVYGRLRGHFAIVVTTQFSRRQCVYIHDAVLMTGRQPFRVGAESAKKPSTHESQVRSEQTEWPTQANYAPVAAPTLAYPWW